MIKFKTADLADVKTEADGLAEGEFTGYAAVWDNKDSYGDIVRKGAFAESLKSYDEGGAGVPAYWGHRLDDPEMNIGKTISAVEDDHGLKVHVKLDMDSPKAAYVHRLISEKRVRSMSFAYAVTDGGFEKSDDDGEIFEIRAADIFEVSVVPVGANPLAELTGVKALADALIGVKVGARHSKADADRLRQIRDLANELLAEGEEEEGDDPSDDETPAAGSDGSEKRRAALAKLAELHTERKIG